MEDLLKENNILLAEFLGWKTDSKDRYITPFGEMDESGYMRYDYEKENLQFDCDWNWLMLVVDKIESLPVTMILISSKTIIIKAHDKYENELKTFQEGVGKTKIGATYNACVEFIKWYNDNK